MRESPQGFCKIQVKIQVIVTQEKGAMRFSQWPHPFLPSIEGDD